MSIDNNSQCIKSKYFTGQTDMDESLSDFQEVKKSCKGPKPALKPIKPKVKKVTKHIKGQKDIRTALKGKKNDLVTYSKEFDTVCKKSGLDIDSEQLQLAIALSKSLQTDSDSPESSQTSLSSQQRVAKIRKTLQEYGFKVPEAKITASKKTKKFRKKYKLLTVTEEEKHQNITGKYTRILFNNLDCSKVEQESFIDQEPDARLFYIASNIPYECMKDNNIFYIENLVEKSTTSGSLLRDWSEIPGRPESPTFIDTYAMNFKDLDCSQDELDIILSGPFKSVKDIFTSKEIEYRKKLKECDVPKIIIEEKAARTDNDVPNIDDSAQELGLNENNLQSHEAFIMKSSDKKPLRSPVKRLFDNRTVESNVIEIISPIKQTTINSSSKAFKEVMEVEISNKLTFTQQYRSCSPDIFDDELSSIMEVTKTKIVLSQDHKTKVFSQEIMDLTQCVNITSQNYEKGIQLSQNVTKRKSNDFMEITECIVGSSQPLREEFKEIDLTQSPDDKGAIIEDYCINVGDKIENVTTDLSNNAKQNVTDSISQNITDEQQITVVSNHMNTGSHPPPKDNIDLTQSSNEDDRGMTTEYNILTLNKKASESLELTQSSFSSGIDGLPLVDVAGSQSQTSLDDTIIVDKNEYIANGKVKKSIFFENEVVDLTQAQDTSVEYNPSPVIEINTESCSNSFYEDFVHDHSENTENGNEVEQQDTDMSKEHNNSLHNISKESHNDIDLTQDSSMSGEIVMSQKPLTEFEKTPNNSSLGKKDDVSIDYDEIIMEDNIWEKESFRESGRDSSLTQQYDSCKSEDRNDIEIVNENNDIDINSSQNSEVFQISDKELDYSLHKSKLDFARDNRFDFGGISVLNNVTKLGNYRKSLSEGCQPYFTENKNDTVEDSFLPEVNVKNNEKKIIETTQLEIDNAVGISPIKVQEVLKSYNGIINIKTPKNREYIIKTEDVTPMADYESMSTPQRNRELDRYGLKPFKRKRAVQILTHLYNQTHPTIQHLVDEDQPSPSKKPRTNTYTPDSSPKKLVISPRNSPLPKTPVKSPRKFVYKRPSQKTRLHTSHRKADELEGDTDIISAPTSKSTDQSDRDRDISSAASSNKAGDIKGVTDVCGYEVTSEVAVVKSVDCSPDDWVFQKREKAKIHSCRIPLHIAFHNYVLSRRSLMEAILKYEPVNIDVIHKDLVGYGHRYDPKDLLKFLDKKCITVKTTDNNARNNKR